MELNGQNKDRVDEESIVESLGSEKQVEYDGHVVFEGDGNISAFATTENIPEEQPGPQTEVVQVGNITSGKSFILTFTDTKYKQINVFPFLLRDGTETGADKDEYYYYNHHWDLRQGHDIEAISELFPEIFPYEDRQQYGFEEITEIQYTELMRYKVYRLIKQGQFVFFENDLKKTYVIWEGNEVRPPVWYIPFEMKDKEREMEAELDDVVEESVENRNEDLPLVPVELEEIWFEGATAEAAAEVAAAAVNEVEGVEEVENEFDFVTEPIPKTAAVSIPVSNANIDAEPVYVLKEEEDPTEMENKEWKFFFEENESKVDLTSTNDFLIDEVRKMDKRIKQLEEELNEQIEINKKYRRTVNVLVILSVVVAAAGVAISLLM